MSAIYNLRVAHTVVSTCTGPREYLAYKLHKESGTWVQFSTSPETLHSACVSAAILLHTFPGVPLGKYTKEQRKHYEAAQELIVNIYMDLANKQFAKGPIATFRNTVEETCIAHISVNPNA